MNFNTSENSKWLEREQEEPLNQAFKVKYEGEAPKVFWNKIQACLKSLKIKKMSDLSDCLQYDHVLSILHHNVKEEHGLICSNYKWSNYGDAIEEHNNKRLTLAGDYAFELDQIAELKSLQKHTKIYKVRHSDTKSKYYTYTYFYIIDGKPIKFHLSCFGFKYGIHQTSPYHSFVKELSEKLKGDSDYFDEVDL